MSAGRILLVDDDASLLRLLGIRLKGAGFETAAADSAKAALNQLSVFRPDLVITDLRMEGMDGIALFDAIHERMPTLPVLILTAYGSIPDAVEATRRGVAGYLTKPLDPKALLEEIRRHLQAEPAAESEDESWRAAIVSNSEAMRELLVQAKRVARSEANVLIQAASGTGKELLARALHRASPRAAQPFVAVNCSALPETLLESELFGHAKGSFTGASQRYKGLIQAADGGTFFLDEIGDMALAAQAKLLRVLESGEVRPVGETEAVTVNVRIIAATNRNLEQAVERGEFREDLFYRVNVIMLEVPPLASRREDIPLLANAFLKEAAQYGDEVEVSGFSPPAMEMLVGAPWPGNVRQLRNVVEHCAALSTTKLVSETLVAKALRNKQRELLPLADAKDRFEAEYLVRLLQMTEGNVAQAARLAERNRSEFYKLLKRHSLDPDLFRPPSE